MKKKVIHFTGLFAMLTFLVLIGGTLAYWRTEGASKSVLELGRLKGSLVTSGSKAEGIYPGDTVQESVDVKNMGGMDMLVRLKVKTDWEDHLAGLSTEAIQIDYNKEKWLAGQDGYFYYKGILKSGETTSEPLYDQFTIDKQISNEYQGKQGNISTSMECLQAAGNAVETWNLTYEDLGIKEPGKKEAQKSEVVFAKDKKFVFQAAGQDIFPSFRNLAPGEAVGQQVLLKNQSDEKVSMFLKPTLPDASSGKKELLEKLVREYAKITITDASGKNVYEGPIAGKDSDQKEISLGSFAAGSEQQFSVTVQLDSAMENEYQGLAAKINWSFIAQGEEGKKTTSALPKTGQEIRYAILGMGSVAVLLVVVLGIGTFRKRKRAISVGEMDSMAD